MNENYIADGEIHELDEPYNRKVYILSKITKKVEIVHGGELDKIKWECFGKISQYIFESNKEKFFEILLHHCKDELLDLMKNALNGNFSPYATTLVNHHILNLEMIYRPAWFIASKEYDAQLSIKFDRVEGDEAYFSKRHEEIGNEVGEFCSECKNENVACVC